MMVSYRRRDLAGRLQNSLKSTNLREMCDRSWAAGIADEDVRDAATSAFCAHPDIWNRSDHAY